MLALLFKRVIFIFQMGRVSSTSIRLAVQEYLGDQYEWDDLWNVREIGNTILSHCHRIVYLGGFYRAMILWRVRLGLPANIICPIREPIARDISAFFYFYCQFVPDLLENANLREIEKIFLTDSRPQPKRSGLQPRRLLHSDRRFALNWFDEHFKPLTRIDVYKQPFPIDRKWQIYRRGFTRILVYRVDLKRSEQTKLISRFLGIKLNEIRSENGAENMDYVELYSRFRESVKLPEQYIRRMHNSRLAQHFWSQEELKVAADKWRDTSSS